MSGTRTRPRAGAGAPLGAALRQEAVGGWLALGAALVAVVWANTPWGEAYERLRELPLGAWGVEETLRHWSSEGLLVVFFLVAALELRRELAVGALRDRRTVAVPVTAALGGVLAPAALYLAFTAGSGEDATRGWPVPTATDIAFALAVLGVIGRRLPVSVRAFLLTLAVVDDLVAIVLIAVLYTADLQLRALLLTAVPLLAFGAVLRRRPSWTWLLVPLAVAVWLLVHRSGVHPTVAGILLALVVPAAAAPGRPAVPGGLVTHLEHRLRPLSAAVAVPLFAFVSGGVVVDGASGLAAALSDPAALGVVVGLVVGKTIGITAGAYLATLLPGVRLDATLRLPDLVVVAILGGVGFTVSLLLAQLSFGLGSARQEDVTTAVLVASLLAALAAAVVARVARRPAPASAAGPAGSGPSAARTRTSGSGDRGTPGGRV